MGWIGQIKIWLVGAAVVISAVIAAVVRGSRMIRENERLKSQNRNLRDSEEANRRMNNAKGSTGNADADLGRLRDRAERRGLKRGGGGLGAP